MITATEKLMTITITTMSTMTDMSQRMETRTARTTRDTVSGETITATKTRDLETEGT